MAEAICDTSALQYLFQAGYLEILPSLFDVITVPEAVLAELRAGRARGVPLPEIESCGWARVKRPAGSTGVPATGDLGDGEREVLALAAETPGAVAVLDDALGRRYARRQGTPVIGTLGLLLQAKRKGLIPAVAPVLDRLEALRFRVDAETRRVVLRLASEQGDG